MPLFRKNSCHCEDPALNYLSVGDEAISIRFLKYYPSLESIKEYGDCRDIHVSQRHTAQFQSRGINRKSLLPVTEFICNKSCQN